MESLGFSYVGLLFSVSPFYFAVLSSGGYPYFGGRKFLG